MASPHKSPFPSTGANVTQGKMIESGSLEEQEYEEQRNQLFSDSLSGSTAKRRISLYSNGMLYSLTSTGMLYSLTSTGTGVCHFFR